jgi:putative redox protein
MRTRAVEVTETRAGKFQVEIDVRGHTILADEPVEVGGLGSGPDTYELLAAALGACTAMTARMYADYKGIALERVRVEVRHETGEGPPRDRFIREVAFDGDLTPEQTIRLFEIVEKCPVHNTLANGSRIETRPLAIAGEPDRDEHFRAMDALCKE